MTTPVGTRNPAPRGNEIYNFGRSFLCHLYYIFSLSDIYSGVEKMILIKIH